MLSHRIRPEAIFERSSFVVERAGHQATRFLRRVGRRLLAARVRGMVVAHESVRLDGHFTPCRPFVVVASDIFGDVRVYVGARAAGVHLEVLVLTTVEPSWLKRVAAGLVRRGAWWSWSLPTAVTRQEDLRTLLTIVETTVHAVARGMAVGLAGVGGLLPSERGNVLENWN